MSIKDKLDEARKSTKVAFLGGALVVAGTWGSCELELSDPGSEAAQEAPAEQEGPPSDPEAEAAQEPAEAEEAAEAEAG